MIPHVGAGATIVNLGLPAFTTLGLVAYTPNWGYSMPSRRNSSTATFGGAFERDVADHLHRRWTVDQ
jgi:hypothetical protein